MTRLHAVAASLIAVAALSGCRNTLIGESCTHSGECSGGLICVGMRCTTGTAGYKPTGKVCVTTECTTASDCVGTQTCTAGKCVCTMDSDCGFGLRCSAGACVRCVVDTDCGMNQYCETGACRATCMDDSTCADFFACTNSRCTFVGCTKDKECAIAVRDVRAKCDLTAKTCFLPCEGDTECGNLTGTWGGLVCSDGRCQSVGCDTDAECRLFLPAGMSGTCVTPP